MKIEASNKIKESVEYLKTHSIYDNTFLKRGGTIREKRKKFKM